MNDYYRFNNNQMLYFKIKGLRLGRKSQKESIQKGEKYNGEGMVKIDLHISTGKINQSVLIQINPWNMKWSVFE